MKKRDFIFLIIVFFISVNSIQSESYLNNEDSFYRISAEVEQGFIWIVNHTIQNGSSGTNFNYVTQGGQDILFPFSRIKSALALDKHNIELLYQPLEVNSEVNFKEDVTIDNVTFSSGTAMDLKYSFPFWRITYLYDFIDSDNFTFSFGAALQIRNASIVFSSIDGQSITVSQNNRACSCSINICG